MSYRMRAIVSRQTVEYLLDLPMMLIGRDVDAKIAIDHPSVSKRHAIVETVEGNVFITDLDSDTGTYVNKKKIFEKTQLFPGDVVRIGDHMFTVMDQDAEAASDKTEAMFTDSKHRRGPSPAFPADDKPETPDSLDITHEMSRDELMKAAYERRESIATGPSLTVLGDRGFLYPVAVKQADFTVGRSTKCHLRLKDPFVSKLHCRLVKRKDRVYIYDENSFNGVYVNAIKIRGVALQDGDLLLIGKHVMEFRDPNSPRVDHDKEEILEKIDEISKPMKRTQTPLKPILIGAGAVAAAALIVVLLFVFDVL